MRCRTTRTEPCSLRSPISSRVMWREPIADGGGFRIRGLLCSICLFEYAGEQEPEGHSSHSFPPIQARLFESCSTDDGKSE